MDMSNDNFVALQLRKCRVFEGRYFPVATCFCTVRFAKALKQSPVSVLRPLSAVNCIAASLMARKVLCHACHFAE